MHWLGSIPRFVIRSFSRAIMGCFFACFRGCDNRRVPTAATTIAVPSFRSNDVVASRNRLSTLFQSEEREDFARSDGMTFDVGSQRDDSGLKDEAKFLKACDTLARTPAEIRKASEKLKVSPYCSKDSGPPGFHSWLQNTSPNKIQLGGQPFNSPTPVKWHEDWWKRTDSSEHTPSSCISDAQNTQCKSLDSAEGSKANKNIASVSPCPSTAYTQSNKSIRFGCDTNLSSCGSSDYFGWHMKKTESQNDEGSYKQLPYPTPMKLSDEIQTPGTVHPATMDLPNGKARVQSQFVYLSYNLGEDVSKSMILEEESCIPQQGSRRPSNSVEQSHNATSTPEKGSKKMSCENESKVGEGLSSWLKPASVILEERNKRMEIAYSQIRKAPADRPIIGMAAAHWIEDGVSEVPPPKWWDGNGIPNSTNKYKEDQKVNWHATPFEERLEKALSEESFVSKKKDVCGKPIAFDENEESDTAISHLQSSTHPQSVMPF